MLPISWQVNSMCLFIIVVPYRDNPELTRSRFKTPASCIPPFSDKLTDWECWVDRPTSGRDYISHLSWDFFFFLMESSSMRLKYLLLHFHLALSPAAMKHSLSIVGFAHKSVTTAYYFLLHSEQALLLWYKMVLLATQGTPEICICFPVVIILFSGQPCVRVCVCFVPVPWSQWVLRTLCVFLPLWSLISTAAWASNSREISSLLPLRAAWCSGDNLHTDTQIMCENAHIHRCRLKKNTRAELCWNNLPRRAAPPLSSV